MFKYLGEIIRLKMGINYNRRMGCERKVLQKYEGLFKA